MAARETVASDPLVPRRDGRHLTVAAAFDFDAPAALAPLDFEALGLSAEAVLATRAPGDVVEVVVVGDCHVPGGEHATSCQVQLTIGSIDKALYVSGDRFWRNGEATPAQPFRQMPVDLAHAYGGPDFADNPAGKGHAAIDLDGTTLHAIPNIQNPAQLIGAEGDPMTLQGFGPLPERAAADQRLKSIEPSMPLTLVNMHPEEPELRGALPAWTLTAEADGGRPVPLRCDGVWLVPAAKRGVLVWRATLEDDGSVAIRSEGAAPYEAPEAPPDDSPAGKAAKLADEARAKAQAVLDMVRAQLVAKGIDPDEHLPASLPEAAEPPPKKDEAAIRADVDAKLDAVRQKIIDKVTASDTDPEAVRKALDEPVAGPPPRFFADAELERIRSVAQKATDAGQPNADLDAKLADGSLERQLRDAEAKLAVIYRAMAHRHPAFDPTKDQAAAARAKALEAVAESRSLAKLDLAGANLAGADLAGLDLEGALLECADLSGAKLDGANLTRAVLAHANLAGADLSGATLVEANVGDANLSGANLRGADFTGAVLVESNLDGADGTDAVLPEEPTGVMAMRDALEAAAKKSGGSN